MRSAVNYLVIIMPWSRISKIDTSVIFPEIVAGVELSEHPPADLGHIDFPDTTDDNVGNSAAERQEHQHTHT